jgi:ABC-type multidrug transport system ATPase subunit
VDFEFPSLYEKLTALEISGSLLRSIKAPGYRRASLFRRLANDANKKVSAFSKGMKSS